MTQSSVLAVAAMAVTVLALVSAGAVLLATRRPAPAISVLLEMFTAAGLIRLSSPGLTWTVLLTAAMIIVLRKTVATAFRRSPG